MIYSKAPNRECLRSSLGLFCDQHHARHAILKRDAVEIAIDFNLLEAGHFQQQPDFGEEEIAASLTLAGKGIMAILHAEPTQDWPVLGLHGQLLGNIARCTVDTETGRIVQLELRTAWQTIGLEWPNLHFDEAQQRFQLNKPAFASRDTVHPSDAAPGCRSRES